jgi:ABC-type transport system substrate-binding protein
MKLHQSSKGKVLLLTPLIAALLLVVACGGAEPAADTAPSQPAATVDTPAAAKDTSSATVIATKDTTDTMMASTKEPRGGDVSLSATALPVATAIPEAAETDVHPGKVTLLAIDFGSERFDDFYAGGSDEYTTLLHGFYREFDRREDGTLYAAPGIMTAWELSPDGLTWTINIREGVKFHDGKELTGEDVAWSMNHMLGPDAGEYSTNSSIVSWSRRAESIKQTGPYQVQYRTVEPATDWLGYTLKVAGGWMVISAVLPSRPNLFDEGEAKEYDRNPIGAGVMKLTDHVQASSMSFERFDDYYYQPDNGLPTDKRVKFRELDLKLVPEESTRVAALIAGDGDIGLVSLPAKDQLERGGARVVFAPEGGFLYAYWINCWRQPELPCNDQRVRQAISYAIDKDLMRDKLFGGHDGFVVKGFSDVTPSTAGYSPALDPFPYDPDKARQLMADAGYPEGKGFPPVIINVAVSKHLPLVPESAQLTADFLKKELGLEVEVRTVDGAARSKAINFTTEMDGQISWSVSECRFDATGYNKYFFALPRDEGDIARLHADQELADLMNQALATYDLAEQEKFLRTKTYPALRDSAHRFALGYSNNPWGVSNRVAEFRPRALASYASGMHTVVLK